MYLLDSNVVSELRKGKSQPSPAVRAWAAQQAIGGLYLSAITALELEMGARLMERKDGTQGAVLRAWVQQVLREFEGRVLPFGETTALLCALEHGFALVTRNVADFDIPGLRVVNPWEAGGIV